MDYYENTCVDRIQQINSTDSMNSDSDLKTMAAKVLASFLSSRLASEDVFFVSGKQKPGEHEHLNGGGCTYNREEIDPEISLNINRSYSEEPSTLGSPLKLQAIANLSVKVPNMTQYEGDPRNSKALVPPVKLKDARKILSKFQADTIFAFCDGNDHNRTVVLGMKKEIIADEKVVTTFRVTADKVRLSEFERSSGKIDQKGFHLTGHYRVLDKRDGLGSVLIEARWSDPLGRMKLTELQAAEFLLHLDILPGNDQSPVFSHYCQLQKISLLLEGLRTRELPEMLSQETEKAVIQLKEWFARIKMGETKPLISNSKRSTVLGGMCGTARQLNLDPTVELDFTDNLWHVVKNCMDINDLLQCFNITFCSLKQGDIKVFVHKTNETTVAKLVRQSYCGMATFPSLTSYLSLRLAVEIGLEKVEKDYYALFTSNGLCTPWQWNSFIQTLTPTQESVVDMDELYIKSLELQFNILSKLHHCLEIVSVVDSFTEGQDLKSITKYVMNHYMSGKIAQSFTIPITALQASAEIKKRPLHYIKRESIGTRNCEVISLMTELPELGLLSLLGLQETGDDCKDYFMFKSQEHSLCF